MYLGISLFAAHLIAWGTSASCRYCMYLSRPAWSVMLIHPLLDAIAGGAWPYRPPPLPDAISPRWYFGDANVFGWGELFAILWLAATPACFLVLGESLRRVQVRRVHLFRALVYSCSVLPVFTLASLGLKSWIVVSIWRSGWFGTGFGWQRWVGEHGPQAVLLIFAAWMIVCWTAIPRRYLRIPHAGLATALILVLSALASLLACTLLLLLISRR